MSDKKIKKDMTDFFGIGTAIKGITEIYFMGARSSGRTSSLIDSIKPGDRIIFRNENDRRYFMREIEFRKDEPWAELLKNIECLVIPVERAESIFSRGTPEGKTIFDHMWLQEFYTTRIQELNKEIAHLERETSGYGEVHRQTKQTIMEKSKWRI